MIPDRNVLLHFSIFLEITTVSNNIFIINIFAPYLKKKIKIEFTGRRAGNSSGWLLEPAVETDLVDRRHGCRVWKAIPRGIHL